MTQREPIDDVLPCRTTAEELALKPLRTALAKAEREVEKLREKPWPASKVWADRRLRQVQDQLPELQAIVAQAEADLLAKAHELVEARRRALPPDAVRVSPPLVPDPDDHSDTRYQVCYDAGTGWVILATFKEQGPAQARWQWYEDELASRSGPV